MTPLGNSDRAAIGLALRESEHSAVAACPHGDSAAFVYARAAGVMVTDWLSETEAPQSYLCLIGLGALERLGCEFPGRLAERNHTTLIFDVLDARRRGQQLIVTKDLAHGAREEWTLAGPAVLVMSPLAVRPPYVSRHRLYMAARALNIDWPTERTNCEREAMAGKVGGAVLRDKSLAGTVVDRGDMLPQSTEVWEPVRPRVKLATTSGAGRAPAHNRLDSAFGLSAAGPQQQAAGNVIQADAATCARHLLRYLAHHGFLAASGKTVAELAAGSVPADSSAAAAGPAIESLNRTAATAPVANDTGAVSNRMARGPRSLDRSPLGTARRPRSIDRETPATVPTARQVRRPRLLNSPEQPRRRCPRLIDPLG